MDCPRHTTTSWPIQVQLHLNQPACWTRTGNHTQRGHVFGDANWTLLPSLPAVAAATGSCLHLW